MSVALAVLVLVAGLLVGVVSALLGVGGGLLMVPFMVIVVGLGQHVAEGTSLVVIVPTALAGVFALRRASLVRWPTVAPLALGGAAASFLGAHTALAVSTEVLSTIFGVLTIGVGLRFLHGALGPARRGRGDA